jgi:hypothetical protein
MTVEVDQRTPGRIPWPTTAVAAADRAFDLLTCGPRPLSLDCRSIQGLPDRDIPLAELRGLLVSDQTDRPTRDAVWRRLVPLARSGDPAWRVAAVGMAVPGLRRIAGLLARGWHGDSSDRDSELVTGFLDRLATIDLSHDRIAGKLIDAAARAVKDARDREAAAPVVSVHATWSMPPRPYADHPEWVLTRAVAAAVISPEEWYLINWTRLEDLTLVTVAGRLGVTPAVAKSWRRRAEQQLVTAIAGGELDRVSIVEAAAKAQARKRERRRARDRALARLTAAERGGAAAAVG